MPRPPRSFDIVAIGESLRDVFYLLDDASVSCTLKKEHCQLCLEYAEKIPVQHVVKVHAAGNSANAAVAAARLGLSAALITWVGKDAEGEDIRAALVAEGVDHRFIATDTKQPTSEATILSYQGEKTQLVHFQPRRYTLPPLPATRAIYYSAMGASFRTFDRALLTALKKQRNAFFIFQPGTTHIRSGLQAVKPFFPFSTLLVLNKDEAHQVLGDGERTNINLLETFHRYGAQKVIITDGRNGADAFDGSSFWHMPVFPIASKESTGAGDSFTIAAGVALLEGHDMPTALRWGAANAASVIQHIGPQTGLLTRTGLSRMLARYPKITAQKIA